MKNITHTIHKAANALLTQSNISTFCNIAEGTHAGFITMIAESDISKPNLLVTHTSIGKVGVAMSSNEPIGVSCDSADMDEALAIALGSSVAQTILCTAANSINAGEKVYLADHGKITATPSAGAYKIGVALNTASVDTVVEVEPQGFGNRAWQVFACGVHTWQNSTTADSFELEGLEEGDAVIASLNTIAGSESCVVATVDADAQSINFTLNAAGTSTSTKINWILIKQS